MRQLTGNLFSELDRQNGVLLIQSLRTGLRSDVHRLKKADLCHSDAIEGSYLDFGLAKLVSSNCLRQIDEIALSSIGCGSRKANLLRMKEMRRFSPLEAASRLSSRPRRT